MLSSAKESNRLKDIDTSIDKRTSGYKRRKEALLKKSDAASKMLDNAIANGIAADYALMDTWFTNEPMIQNVISKNLNVIGMVKDLKQRYSYGDSNYTLKELRKQLPTARNKAILGSLCVKTKHGIPAKLVFVRNRNKRRKCLVILSSNLQISNAEIVRIYSLRWNIEVFFKSTKSFLKLGSEFQGRSFDMLISHTTIVFMCYILLEWERRNNQDERTFGNLFLCFEMK